MEISMVHVLPAEFQPITSQPNFLDGDVVAKEETQVDFVAIEETEQVSKDDKLKAALAKLFPRFSSINLQHLKPLYVTTYIEGYPVSKIFVDCGTTVNIMPVTIIKALHRSNDELIPSRVTISSFVGDKSQTKGVLPLEVNIASRNHMIVFFIIDSKIDIMHCSVVTGSIKRAASPHRYIKSLSSGTVNQLWFIRPIINHSRLI
ncbi:hypothetical protein ACFX2B_009489 [Malus domestica]